MRMNPTRGRTASALLSELGESGMAQLLAENSAIRLLGVIYPFVMTLVIVMTANPVFSSKAL